ncbi:MAG: chorismate-binding protein [bacterium]
MTYLNLEQKSYTFTQKKLAINLPIYEVFKRIYSRFDTVYFLESLGELEDFSRYSIIGFSPRNHLSAKGQTLTVDGNDHQLENPFYALREINQVKIPQASFCGGLVGYLSYEGTRYFEPSVDFKNNSAFPDFEFGLYLDGIMYDKKTKDFYYFYLDTDRSEDVLNAVAKPVELQPFNFQDLGPNTTREEYNRMIDQCIEHIKAGDIFQVIMSVQFRYELSGSPLFLYENLRKVNPSPHMYFLKFGRRQLIGASPELVVRYQVDHTGMIGNRIENYPLAGTTERGKTPIEDEQLAAEMLKDKKERAEHMMLVDMGRNDIGRVSKFGSVEVPKLMVVKKYSHVQHIASEIEGEVRDDKDAFDCLAATAPMGTGSGAPKVEAMKIINNLEKDPRGPYSGEIGYFSFNGDCMFCIGFRSIFVDGNQAYSASGSGVVFDSTADYEYREILRKGAGMKITIEQTQQLSKKKLKKEYTLEELRENLDESGEKILYVLADIQREKALAHPERLVIPQSTDVEKKQWLQLVLKRIGSGIDNTEAQEFFSTISLDGKELQDILVGKYFDNTGIIAGDPKLNDRGITLLQSFLDTDRHDLLEPLQERCFWIQHVSRYKKERGIEIRKIEREKQLIAKMEKRSIELGIDPEMTRLLYIYVVLPMAFLIEEVMIG